MSVIDGVSIYLTRGTIISGFPDAFQWIGNGTVFDLRLPSPPRHRRGRRRTRAQPHAVRHQRLHDRSNLEATRYSGVDTRRVIIGVYTLSSVLCFLAGTLMMARFNSASAEYAAVLPPDTILSAVLGGIDPFGGFGRIAGPDDQPDRAAGHFFGPQSSRSQPASHPRDLGFHPDRSDGSQVLSGASDCRKGAVCAPSGR